MMNLIGRGIQPQEIVAAFKAAPKNNDLVVVVDGKLYLVIEVDLNKVRARPMYHDFSLSNFETVLEEPEVMGWWYLERNPSEVA